MRDDGVRRALVFATSATSSYSGCRQYRDDLAQARAGGRRPVRRSWSSCGTSSTIRASSRPTPTQVRAALRTLPAALRDSARLVFTAHSIPVAMNDASGPQRGRAVRGAAARDRAAGRRGGARRRRGRSTWCGSRAPGRRRCRGSSRTSTTTSRRWPRPACARWSSARPASCPTTSRCVWDLDTEARATADELGLAFARAATAGTHPGFVAAIRELVEEQTVSAPARWLGRLGVCGWECPPGCCVVLTHGP